MRIHSTETAHWLTLYFSGTGNTKYVAKKFSQLTGSACYSIEESWAPREAQQEAPQDAPRNFANMIQQAEVITLCYPIHHSTAPVIMKKFVMAHSATFAGKKVIILCTQQFYSGDGAHNITKYLSDVEILYAEHINMPSNIVNLPVYSQLTKGNVQKRIKLADKKLARIVADIKAGKVHTRGFSRVGQALGKLQNGNEKTYMSGAKEDIQVTKSCILCKKCVKLCPTHTLEVKNGTIVGKGDCTFCWRCVNICPVQAITVNLHGKPRYQHYIVDQVEELL